MLGFRVISSKQSRSIGGLLLIVVQGLLPVSSRVLDVILHIFPPIDCCLIDRFSIVKCVFQSSTTPDWGSKFGLTPWFTPVMVLPP